MIANLFGLPGMGKTLSASMMAYRLWKETGSEVYANYSMRFPINDVSIQHNVHYEFGLFPLHWDKVWQTEKQQYYYPKVVQGPALLEAIKQKDKAIFVIDEAGTVFSNREWKDFPKWIMARFRESRHVGLEIIYTAQSYSDVDVKLRQLTNFFIQCKWYKIKLSWPFKFYRDIAIKNEWFHHEILNSDTPANRKQYRAGTDYILAGEFLPFFDYYNTYEKFVYEAPPDMQLEKLIKPNKFEVGEWETGGVRP